jgi:hypothetical protein
MVQRPNYSNAAISSHTAKMTADGIKIPSLGHLPTSRKDTSNSKAADSSCQEDPPHVLCPRTSEPTGDLRHLEGGPHGSKIPSFHRSQVKEGQQGLVRTEWSYCLRPSVPCWLVSHRQAASNRTQTWCQELVSHLQA